VAVLLDAPVRAALGAEIDRLRPLGRGVAWVAPENLHLTLKFLGEVEEGRTAELTGSLTGAVAGLAPFEAVIEGLGGFPTPTRPRVLWAGVTASGEALGRLAARVEAALAALGFAREGRPFSAHVTLGRVRLPRRNPALSAALAAGAARSFGTSPVGRVSLMRSELSPRGARYTELAALPLGGAGREAP
jgi:2'-5' RNA ligase